MKKIILLLMIACTGMLLMAFGYVKISKAKEAYKEVEKYAFVGKMVEPFKVEDLEGNPWSNEIYSDYKLTMHVFWSPHCVPCIEELKALQTIKDEEETLQVKLISFCVEGSRQDVLDLKKSYPMDYPVVLLADNPLMEDCIKDFEFIPFVIFVDQKGNYVKEFLVGSRTYDEYVDHIKTLLEKYSGSAS